MHELIPTAILTTSGYNITNHINQSNCTVCWLAYTLTAIGYCKMLLFT